MNFFELIKSRRSIRKFSPQSISRDLIEKIIESGAYAPSACNIQGWRFVVVDEPLLKEKIFDLGGSAIIRSAPVVILVFYDNRTTNTEYADYIQSAAAAMQNMLLAAAELGLGACWVAHLPRKKDLRKLFNSPKYFEPIAAMLLGFKDGSPDTAMPRKFALAKIVGYNAFADIAEKTGAPDNLFLKRLARKIYYRLPGGPKKLLNNFIDKNFVKKFKN
ncbi:MAG: nitroreductase family protein [Candidatus Portnoybacteria bacterium]|nr:nitroreductase family protein [Candidatus Portnoybacteria bacterium]MDD4982460.1 nitroreductase family protein [Candidatus Portnoybacteria bacterium]